MNAAGGLAWGHDQTDRAEASSAAWIARRARLQQIPTREGCPTRRALRGELRSDGEAGGQDATGAEPDRIQGTGIASIVRAAGGCGEGRGDQCGGPGGYQRAAPAVRSPISVRFL